MLAGGVALGGLLLTSCALPGTSAPVANLGSTVHIAGAPVVVPAPTIVVTPGNSAQGVALDAPVVVNVATGHLDTVSLSQAGSSTVYSRCDVGGRHLVGDVRTARSQSALHRRRHCDELRGQHLDVHDDVRHRRREESPADRHDAAQRSSGRRRRDDRPSLQHRHPHDVRAALLERIHVTSTPAVMGGWHWLTDQVVHFRPATFWPSGAKVTVVADLDGFSVGGGVWGLGDWTSSFSVGAKHVSIINNLTHTMQVFDNDKLFATYPVSLGKGGFPTLSGTLIVLYKTPVVVMKSCPTFHTPAACIPGGSRVLRRPGVRRHGHLDQRLLHPRGSVVGRLAGSR